MKLWTSTQLAILSSLRERFLKGKVGEDYWSSEDELALYDATFAQRISWKWDAVLRELHARNWRPQSRALFDWGCGSGIAARCVMAHWPQFASLTLHDRSPLALHFAAQRARDEHPAVAVRCAETLPPDALLILSHVINELSPVAFAQLLKVVGQAREVIWVEAGTHADSRRLIGVREHLVGSSRFAAVAPCTHQKGCGMLAAQNAVHWCHHFAPSPSGAFQDAGWNQFSRELGIDLRSLPYSFLVVEQQRRAPPLALGSSRVIGRSRDFKGYSKVLSCQADGVTDYALQKRDAPQLLREVRKGTGLPIYTWTIEEGKIVDGTPSCEQRDCGVDRSLA